jgi:hypothetical protein
MKNTKTNVWSFATAKLHVIIAIAMITAVIGFSMTACAEEEEEGGGTLTITGLGDYDNSYARASYDTRYTSAVIVNAGAGRSSKPGKISGGKVTLNVFNENEEGFTGSGEATLTVLIYINDYDIQGPGDVGTVTVTFKNGSGEGEFKSNK